MLSKYAPYILAVSLFILGIFLGFFAGKNTAPSTFDLMQTGGKNDDSFYSSQTASIRGKITKIDGNNLVAINLNTNTSGDVTLSDGAIITKPGKTSTGADKANLETDKEVLISLEKINGKYEAVAIQYVNPPPSLPPLPSIKPAT